MFEAASFADASFSPKNRCEAGGCKVISHKENTIWIISWGCEASTWKNDKRKKNDNAWKHHLIDIGVFRQPHVLQEALVKRCIKRSSSNSSSSRSSRAWSKTAVEGTWAVHSMIRQMLVALMIPVHFFIIITMTFSTKWLRTGCSTALASNCWLSSF